MDLKFGDWPFNRQIAKLKPPPKFPVIRYWISWFGITTVTSFDSTISFLHIQTVYMYIPMINPFPHLYSYTNDNNMSSCWFQWLLQLWRPKVLTNWPQLLVWSNLPLFSKLLPKLKPPPKFPVTCLSLFSYTVHCTNTASAQIDSWHEVSRSDCSSINGQHPGAMVPNSKELSPRRYTFQIPSLL